MPIAALWPLPPIINLPIDSPVSPALTEDDFTGFLQARLPTGPAWPRDTDAPLTALLRGIAACYARVHARIRNLIVDAFPATTDELLPEWEASVGLPDPCIGVQALVSERRAQLLARLTNRGGQSIAYFIEYARTLGYVITITEFAPSRFGHHFGEPFGGIPWAFAWQVNAQLFTIRYFEFGTDVMGDPFADWSAGNLECEIRRFRPGHTVVLFAYS